MIQMFLNPCKLCTDPVWLFTRNITAALISLRSFQLIGRALSTTSIVTDKVAIFENDWCTFYYCLVASS